MLALWRIYPFIKFNRRRIALAATAAAGCACRQFAEIALADPFSEHAAQGIGIHVEMMSEIKQRDAALLS
jgi:hypothetical protein